MKKLRYGCVGAGGVADHKHLKHYSMFDNVELAAISDPRVDACETLAKKYGIQKTYENYIDMLENEHLDFISVCTPNYLHKPVTLEALKRGIHVHCEKPIAMNASEAQEMVECKDRTGKKLMVGLNNRFTNHAYFVKRLAESGELGEVYHAKCGWRRRRGIPGKGGWFTNSKLSGGGPLIDLGVHFIDLVMYFMGYPLPVAVSGAVYSKFSDNTSLNSSNYATGGEGVYDVEDLAVGFIRLENGATIDIEFSWASNIEKEYNYYELLGTKSGVMYKDGELKIFGELNDTCINVIPDLKYKKKPLDEFEHFIDCIVNDKEPMSKPEEAAKLMQIIDGIYASSKERREIRL